MSRFPFSRDLSISNTRVLELNPGWKKNTRKGAPEQEIVELKNASSLTFLA